MYIAGAVLLSGAIGGLFGYLLGPYGLIISVPIALWLGHIGAQMQIESKRGY